MHTKIHRDGTPSIIPDFRDFGRALHVVSRTSNVRPAAPSINDRRTPEQQETHTAAVVARDPGMSGWGDATGGASYCVWACAPGVDLSRVLAWVGNRSDMEAAAEIDLSDWQPPEDAAHVSIYAVEQGHPATINAA